MHPGQILLLKSRIYSSVSTRRGPGSWSYVRAVWCIAISIFSFVFIVDPITDVPVSRRSPPWHLYFYVQTKKHCCPEATVTINTGAFYGTRPCAQHDA